MICWKRFFVYLILMPLLGCQTQPREKRAVSEDGVEISYSVRGEGEPALVFVHGWSCDRSYWKAQADRFARAHRVITVDLAGHGSSGSDREEWSMLAFGGDVASAVAEEAPESVILIGHSMGGGVILEAARRLRGSVTGLIGVDTYQNVEIALASEQVEAFLAPFRADFAGTTRAFAQDMFREGTDADLVERVVRDMSSAPQEVGVASMRAAFLYRPSETLERLNLPVVGVNSDLYPVNTDAFLRHTASTFVVHVLGNTGHFPMLERPEAFNETLAQAISSFIE